MFCMMVPVIHRHPPRFCPIIVGAMFCVATLATTSKAGAMK